jgi:hypothetical protein
VQTWRVRVQVYPRGRKMSRGPSEILQIDAGKELRLMQKKRVRHNLFTSVLPNYRVACSQAIPRASCSEFDSARAISALTARRSHGTHPSGGSVLIEIRHAFNIMFLRLNEHIRDGGSRCTCCQLTVLPQFVHPRLDAWSLSKPAVDIGQRGILSFDDDRTHKPFVFWIAQPLAHRVSLTH